MRDISQLKRIYVGINRDPLSRAEGGGQCVWDSGCFLDSVLEQPAYYQEATDRCQVRSLLEKLPLA